MVKGRGPHRNEHDEATEEPAQTGPTAIVRPRGGPRHHQAAATETNGSPVEAANGSTAGPVEGRREERDSAGPRRVESRREENGDAAPREDAPLRNQPPAAERRAPVAVIGEN